MTKNVTGYYRPQNLAEALALLAQPGMRALGGGTKLLAGEVDAAVVDLQALGLNNIEVAGGRLVVGAITRLADLDGYLEGQGGEPAADELTAAGLLRRAIRQAGPNTYRNAATIGGTVAARLADSELLAALLALEAELTLRGHGDAEMALARYLGADERPHGLITAVTVAWTDGAGRSARVARTPADDPIVSVTAWRPEGGRPRLAATGVAERPIRLAAAEDALAGSVSAESIGQAAAAARREASHPGDFRGDAGYRAAMAEILTRRVLSGA